MDADGMGFGRQGFQVGSLRNPRVAGLVAGLKESVQRVDILGWDAGVNRLDIQGTLGDRRWCLSVPKCDRLLQGAEEGGEKFLR